MGRFWGDHGAIMAQSGAIMIRRRRYASPDLCLLAQADRARAPTATGHLFHRQFHESAVLVAGCHSVCSSKSRAIMLARERGSNRQIQIDHYASCVAQKCVISQPLGRS